MWHWLVIVSAICAAAAPAAGQVASERIVVERDLPDLDKPLELFDRTRLHYAATYIGGHDGVVRLRIGKLDAPATILLSSWEPVEWLVEGDVPSEVEAVVLMRGHDNAGRSVLRGLPERLPVYRLLYAVHWGWRTGSVFDQCSRGIDANADGTCRPPEQLTPVHFGLQALADRLRTLGNVTLSSQALGYAADTLDVPGARLAGHAPQPNPRDRADTGATAPATPTSRFEADYLHGLRRAVESLKLRHDRFDPNDLRGREVEVKLVSTFGIELFGFPCAPADQAASIEEYAAKRACERGPVTVEIESATKDIVLVLESFRGVDWNIRLNPGVRLSGIVLHTIGPSLVQGIRSSVPLWWAPPARLFSPWRQSNVELVLPGAAVSLVTPDERTKRAVIQ